MLRYFLYGLVSSRKATKIKLSDSSLRVFGGGVRIFESDRVWLTMPIDVTCDGEDDFPRTYHWKANRLYSKGCSLNRSNVSTVRTFHVISENAEKQKMRKFNSTIRLVTQIRKESIV